MNIPTDHWKPMSLAVAALLVGLFTAAPLPAAEIEVVTGCMFSGKTEELIRRLNRARYATQRSPEEVASLVVLSTLLSLVTLPLILAWVL